MKVTHCAHKGRAIRERPLYTTGHPEVLVRFTLALLALVLSATACRQLKYSADDRMQKALVGTWMFEAKYTHGGSRDETMTFAPDGSYASTISMPSRTNGPRTVSLEGTFRVEGGILIAIVTKNSQAYAPNPSTNRYRIVRLDGRELALDYERLPGSVYPTNEVVYWKDEGLRPK